MSSSTLVQSVRRFLGEQAPFSQMAPDDVDFVARRLELAYFGAGDVIVAPSSGPPVCCWIVKQGVVDGLRPAADSAADEAVMHLTPGEIFPVGALLADRAVSSTYRAGGDCFCWRLAREHFDELTRRSPVFLDFCRRRMAALLDLSRQALQASFAAQASQWRSMSQPLSQILRREAVTCREDTSLRAVFELMEDLDVGSVVVMRATGEGAAAVAGIFTRQDVVGRVVLPGVGLEAPVGTVMTSPVLTASADETVADAMLRMAERTIRHLPVVRDSELIGVVTERDLFALQRRSLRQIGDSIRVARTTQTLRQAADDIREWSLSLVAQGVSPEFVTGLISRLNDQLTGRLLALTAQAHDIDLATLCWLALGSEGRQEQTIATDQDNGLIVGPTCRTPIAQLLTFAQAVNQALDECGYPLCRGGVMAGNPHWCLDAGQWSALFRDWIDRGDPQALLNASVFFDFRALAGDAALAQTLSAEVVELARASPRFLKQMSDNALRNRPPQAWTGGLLDQLFASEPIEVDLKMQGTTPFVDAARVLALAHGVRLTGTAERLHALTHAGALPLAEVRAWVDAFQFLQGLRLRVQQRGAPLGQANHLDVRQLSELDRRILKEAFRQARKLQQRLALDYPG